MHEIKFRIWNNKHKKFYYFNGFNLFNFNNEELSKSEQYTGLKDKNGKEIYEGDTCIYLGTNMSAMKIVLENGYFVGKGPFNTHPLIDYINADDFESIEVVGNIHENTDGVI